MHIVGGGAHHTLLCRLTADATGLPVVAGPTEAAALGNVLVQARAAGVVSEDLHDLRALLRDTQPLRHYDPASSRAAWDEAACRLGTGPGPEARRSPGTPGPPGPPGTTATPGAAGTPATPRKGDARCG